MVKNLLANAGAVRSLSIPWRGEHGSCLENPTDRGAWLAIVQRVAESWTQLKLLSRHARLSLSMLKFLERLQLKVL